MDHYIPRLQLVICQKDRQLEPLDAFVKTVWAQDTGKASIPFARECHFTDCAGHLPAGKASERQLAKSKKRGEQDRHDQVSAIATQIQCSCPEFSPSSRGESKKCQCEVFFLPKLIYTIWCSCTNDIRAPLPVLTGESAERLIPTMGALHAASLSRHMLSRGAR